MAPLAPGAALIAQWGGKSLSLHTYQLLALGWTFLAYTLYHAARKPPSIVKSSLDPEKDLRFLGGGAPAAGWPPFNSAVGKGLLGDLDVAFLGAYAAGMFVAGHLGDRVDLRLFLFGGMFVSGFFTVLFGMGYFWNVHSLCYFLLVQMAAGAFQSTGWPSVVSVVANWHGKKRLGFIMGCWNAHVSIGNITGSLIAAAVLDQGWGYSFVVPGVLLMGGGVLMYLFLVVHPEDVGLTSPPETQPETQPQPGTEVGGEDEEASTLLTGGQEGLGAVAHEDMKGISFWEAWQIPGVAPFAFCLFFTKLVAYCLMFWLPFYIRHTNIDGKYLSDAASGRLSTLFDIGGVVGGIVAGSLSDHLTAPASTAAGFMYLAIPCLWVYFVWGHVSLLLNILLMMLAGIFVNGPYALITTAVSADLGRKGSLNNSRATAIVTAIIDGSGSVGAAIGPLLTGWISQAGKGQGWRYVFYMLMLSALIAALLLTKLVYQEHQERKRRRIPVSQETPLEH